MSNAFEGLRLPAFDPTQSQLAVVPPEGTAAVVVCWGDRAVSFVDADGRELSRVTVGAGLALDSLPAGFVIEMKRAAVEAVRGASMRGESVLGRR